MNKILYTAIFLLLLALFLVEHERAKYRDIAKIAIQNSLTWQKAYENCISREAK